MKKQIRKLRLREGDIILVHDARLMKPLLDAAKTMKNVPNCPIVFAEGVHRISLEYLQKHVAKFDNQ